MKADCPRALIDTSVLRRSKVAEAGVFTHTIQVGSRQAPIRLVGVRQKPLPSADQKWLREQIEALPTVARLARENRLSLCS
jgi:hypothetical protein